MITTDELAATAPGKDRVITLWTLSGLVAFISVGGKLAGAAAVPAGIIAYLGKP